MSCISSSRSRSGGRVLAVPGELSPTLVLVLGTYAVGADAFVIAGFLPSIAGALDVSTADGGRAITAFVLTYAVLAPVLAAATARVPRRVLLAGALTVIGLANLVSALAPSLPVLIGGRMLAAAGAAAYTPIAARVCTTLVRPRARMTALTLIIGGMAVAVTLGLAFGEVAGGWLGWRAALGAVSLVCLLAGAGVALTLPSLPARSRPRLPRLPVLPAVVPITVLGVLVAFGAYAYGVPELNTIGLPDAAAVVVLFAYGLGAMFANTVTGMRRAGEERRRIARELHDSLTHNITLIKVQASIALHLARQRGEPVPASLLAIEEASTEAMRELRAALHLLRDPDGEPVGGGLDRLSGLLDRARSAGVPTAMTVSGERRTLPGEVDRTAYRVVQEALTNVSRHAGGASVLVRVAYRPDRVTVQVDDDGRATLDAPPEPGIGLTGMRERVAALGGRLHAGPRHDGGFTVQAELPLDARNADSSPAATRHP
ncbi:sensor histidine kinase [Actinoallomurus sp. CA-142502]|uniref:sensor histidine kinase n=1 Tax=Actinoallomurus sp. CA-142502 TaxID=3239885 RepID=UPI003D905C13